MNDETYIPAEYAPEPFCGRKQSGSLAKWAPAFVAAQLKIKNALKDSTNPHFNKAYADLASVSDACKQHLNEAGIGILQFPAPAPDGKLGLETMLLHTSGEFLSGTGYLPIDRGGPQAYGSALTYARRYYLAAITGVCPADDDGNAANRQQEDQHEYVPPAPLSMKRPAEPKMDDALADDKTFVSRWRQTLIRRPLPFTQPEADGLLRDFLKNAGTRLPLAQRDLKWRTNILAAAAGGIYDADKYRGFGDSQDAPPEAQDAPTATLEGNGENPVTFTALFAVAAMSEPNNWTEEETNAALKKALPPGKKKVADTTAAWRISTLALVRAGLLDPSTGRKREAVTA